MQVTRNNRVKIFTAFKYGIANSATEGVSGKKPLFQFDRLMDAGWIQVTGCGEENVYFIWTDDEGEQQEGYCKCLV